MTGKRKSDHRQPSASMFSPPATPEQLKEIRELGGRPREDLSHSQANTAISALKHRQRRRAQPGPNVENIRSSAQAKRGVTPRPKASDR